MRSFAFASITLLLYAVSWSCGPGAGSGDADADTDADTDADADTDTVQPDHVNYLVVTTDGLAEVAAEFARYRNRTGFRAEVHRASELAAAPYTAAAMVTAVHGVLDAAVTAAPAGAPIFLLLLGDAPGAEEPANDLLPVTICENNYGDCFTDNTYGDLDGDRIPEVAVGRIPARTPERARAYLEKLEAHESEYEPGLWNRRLSLYTGQGGYGEEIDGMIEMMVLEGLKVVDHAFDIIGAYDNPASPYYYTPFQDKVVELINAGNLITMYIGHGSEGWTQGLPIERMGEIRCEHRYPLAFFFACLTGAFAGEEDAISEMFLFKPDGAVTVFASSDISHPYGNAVLPYETQRALLNARADTLGEALLLTKRQAIENEDEMRSLMDSFAALAGVLEEEREVLRYQHNDLYNLLGDPAVSIRYPRAEIDLAGAVEGSYRSGRLTVRGAAPGLNQGTALVSLECERDQILEELEEIDPQNPDPAKVQRNWAKAVDMVVTEKSVPVEGDGAFEATLEFRSDLPRGDYYIKAYADDGKRDAFGYIAAP